MPLGSSRQCLFRLSLCFSQPEKLLPIALSPHFPVSFKLDYSRLCLMPVNFLRAKLFCDLRFKSLKKLDFFKISVDLPVVAG